MRRGLDDIARELFGPLLTARPGASGWRVLSWDAEQGLSITLARGRRTLLIEFEDRNETRDCFARTTRFNVCARAEYEAGSGLSDLERRLVEQVVGVVRTRETRLPVPPFVAPRKAHVREVLVDRMLIPEGERRYYLNAFMGCTIGCLFCYVAERAALSRRLDGQPEVVWGAYADVKINAAEVLRREVEAFPPGIVRMSPILTDPYQPLERRYRITRSCLEVLLSAGFTPAILTRGSHVADDLDLLRRFPTAAVGLSIPTDDDNIRRLFEPRADPIEKRVAALAACHSAGLATCVVIQPMLPMNPERLVALVAPLVRAVRIDRMHMGERTHRVYVDNDLLHATTDAFFESTRAALEKGFREYGVRIDEKDDLTGLLLGTT